MLERLKPSSSALLRHEQQAAPEAHFGAWGGDEFSFAGFRLEADGTLFRGEAVVHLPPRELAALRLLLTRAGQIVTPNQLRDALWGDVHVTADSVPKCLSSLRARLEPEDCIQTVYKRGYRLSVAVRHSGVGVGPALPRLAIPPFSTEFGIPNHLGPSVAEETITRLSNAYQPGVSVLARDSVFTLAHRGSTAQQIGETLKADLVLAGTLRALPAHFHLRTEMIRVEDGAQIWVEDLLVDKSRIAGLELELVDRLAFRLKTAASRHGHQRPTFQLEKTSVPSDFDELSRAAEEESSSQTREAYEIYQRARYEWQTLERHSMQDSMQHLARATELDPSLAAAKIDLAHLSVTQAFYGFMAPMAAADVVRSAVEPSFHVGGNMLGRSALRGGTEANRRNSGYFPIRDLPHQLDAILPALAWVNFHVDRDLPAAIEAFERSAHLRDPWSIRARVMFALSRHNFSQAIPMLRAALDHDPFSPWLHAHLAWALHLDGQSAESVKQMRHALTLFPGHEGPALYGAVILAFNGEAAVEIGSGVELAQTLVKSSPYFDLAASVHAYALACEGRAKEAKAVLERLQWLSRERFVLSSFNAPTYVVLGDHDAAIAELIAADEVRCPWLFQMIADPRLKPLHGRAEFIEMQEMLSRMEDEAAAEHSAVEA